MNAAMDPRYGRPFGEHGTADQAVTFLLDHSGLFLAEAQDFLDAWRHGDLEVWPEFNTWLAGRRIEEEASCFLDIVRAQGLPTPDYLPARIFEELTVGEVIACHRCGDRWPTSLIDCKAPLLPLGEMIRQRRLRSPDFTIHLCPPCYGPNWEPA